MNGALGVVGLLALAACSDAPAPAGASAQVLDEVALRALAGERLQPFKQQLMQALQAGMQQGAVQAIDVCRLQAPAIATAASGDGVQVGRTSHRLRNPANEARPWQQHVLDSYLSSDQREPMVMDLGNGRAGYAEPIITAPLCLACHGQDIAPEVQAVLAQHYPEDQATGFEAGDLRGIFWVTLPVPGVSVGH